jgi:hypothetical protein
MKGGETEYVKPMRIDRKFGSRFGGKLQRDYKLT